VCETLAKLRCAAEASKYAINEDKSTSAAEQVDSFNINITSHSMRITNERINEFQSSIMQAGNSRRSQGILSYVKTVNMDQGTEIQRLFNRHFQQS
jgi:hypothetical protein